MELTTVHLSKSYCGCTVAKVYKDQSTFEIILPEFVILNQGNFTKDETTNILCKLGKHKEQLLILAQRECAIDL